MKTFQHNFKSESGIIDVNGINGYMQAMQVILDHLEEVTQFSLGKRYIDAVPILDKIAATNEELGKLLKEALEDLNETKKEIYTLDKTVVQIAEEMYPDETTIPHI